MSVEYTNRTDEDCRNDNYMQVVPMTFEERVKMYMDCSHESLAKMMAQRDIIDQLFAKGRAIDTEPLQIVRWPDYEFTCSDTTYTSSWASTDDDECLIKNNI